MTFSVFLPRKALWRVRNMDFGKLFEFFSLFQYFLRLFWYNMVPRMDPTDAQFGLQILCRQGNSGKLTLQTALYPKSKGYFLGVYDVIMSLKMETFDKKLHFGLRDCLKNVLKGLYKKSKFGHFRRFCTILHYFLKGK